MRLLKALVVIPATLAACDALVRGVLWVAARRHEGAGGRAQGAGDEAASSGISCALRPAPCALLAVIPARDEGERLEQTLASAEGQQLDVLLLLDGEDAVAAENARNRGARVVVKTPAGPSKAAALAWLAREHKPLIETYDAVLIVDAGSRFTLDFHLPWPDDADAVQTWLSGTSAGVGAAAAESERVAQTSEDRGREALGWNVRLRGTGTAFRARTFVELMPRLDTRIEDLEATLLLTADGKRIRLVDARILDEKPYEIAAAASQRSRWILGRYELLFRRAPAFGKVIATRPLEGVAFLLEIFGRPFSLTAPLRVLAALLVRGAFGGALALTAVADVALHAAAHRQSPGAVLRLAWSWVLAVLLAPRALLRWTRS
jgi:Glycosyl transferase family group 2